MTFFENLPLTHPPTFGPGVGNFFLWDPLPTLINFVVTTRIWNSPYDGQIRLLGAQYTNQGRVEVYCNGQWGTICDDGFGSTDANTVCRQQGYTRAAAYDDLTSM